MAGLSIKISGARQHNLKNLCLEIPHNKLIAVTGISGSGKSSLAFDTIASEGRRLYLESIPSFARQFSGKVSKPDVDEITGLYPVITVEQKISGSSVRSTVGTLSELYGYLRLLFARFGQHPNNRKLSRGHFSFNTALGACPVCSGLGLEEKISVRKLVANPDKTLRQGALVPTLPNGYIMYSQVTVDVLNTVCQQHGFHVDIPWKDLSEEQKDVVLNGSNRIKVLYGKHSLDSRLKWTALKAKPREEGYYKGMLPVMEDILRRDRNKNILRFAEAVTCSSCHGKRLNQEALAVTYQGKTIDYLGELELTGLKGFFETLVVYDEGEKRIIDKMVHQLRLLCHLGVSYLHLGRGVDSLTSGEIQRIRLVNQLSADLSNVLYVFDEPSVGMHPRDQKFMVSVLKALVGKGNTVIVVEHDPEVIRQSDWVIEIGPDAGANGGRLVYNGCAKEFVSPHGKGKLTYTQQALLTRKPDQRVRKKDTESYLLRNCHKNNLRDIDVGFKKYSLNVITGVPGAGKSSLVHGCLVPSLGHVVQVDQKPIGRTPRSNPATYTGLSDHIRDLFVSQPKAEELGFKKGRFSFNNKGGRCETCEGAGKIQIGMHYMGNVDLVCDTCNGKRFNEETLQVRYKKKSIADIYDLSVDEAFDTFEGEPQLRKYLETFKLLGLGYLKLGQSSTTLSGGEAQRIKLAAGLVRKPRKDTWFILNEPSTGLHYQDTLLLIKALRQLTDQGSTVVYIEYQQQLIEAADWIIELGPESGKKGGELVFQGGWEDFKKANSVTSRAILDDVMYEPPEVPGDNIKIIHATTHNLKGIDVRFPKNKITVVTGLSGSGKSSLAFDTLFAESQSRFSESLSVFAKSFIKQSNLAQADAFENVTPVIAINRKNLTVSTRSTVGTLTGINEKYRFLFSRIAALQGKDLPAKSFSFNHGSGACPSCEGLGNIITASPHKLAPDWNMSVLGGAFTHNATISYYGNPDGQFVAILKEVARAKAMDLNMPIKNYPEKERAVVFYGTGEKVWETVWAYKTKTGSGTKKITGAWKGFCNLIDEEYKRSRHNKTVDRFSGMLHEVDCGTCHGARLNKNALSVKIAGLSIHDLSSLSVNDTLNWFEKTDIPYKQKVIAHEIYVFVKPVLHAMKELGLGHLSFIRNVATLSGGEGQRLRLAKQLHGSLTGITYILDEPTIGLHPRNVDQLLQYIQKLKEKGNTIIMVEHDRDVIKFADHIIEMGPGPGTEGGEIVAQGDYPDFLHSPHAITPPFLKSNVLPGAKDRKILKNSFGLTGVNKHNLKNRDFHFHANGIIALTGVSGSGKSTLVHHVLAPTLAQNKAVNCKRFYVNHPFDQVIVADQQTLFGTSSSTCVSYTGLLPHIQHLFASTDAAKKAGLNKNAFSYNHKDGKCPYCNGHGQVKIPMDFMEDVWNACDVCNGTRYKKEVLDVRVKGKNVFDLLSLSVSEAHSFLQQNELKAAKSACKILAQLSEIGLGHIKLIQTTSSLSGGESQRVKLAVHLLQSTGQKILFLLDEPSSGLHYKDLDQLIRVFDNLADSGHTVLFIEHNSYLISVANQVVELN